jgi:hypothetical protein
LELVKNGGNPAGLREKIANGKEASMNSSPSPAAAEPATAAATADERLKRAYQQIASADEQLALVNEKLSRMEHDAAPRDLARKRLLVAGRRPTGGGPALRGFIGLLLVACIAGAAFVFQSPSGGATRQMIARWVSPVLASSVPLQRPGSDAPPSPVQLAAAETTAPPASSPAPVSPQDAAPAAAPVSPELAQQLQTITSQIANLDQKLEQLRASQEQMVIQMTSNNARAIGEFKAGQEQIMRLMAKASEPNARPKTSLASSSASPARPVAAIDHQPASTRVSPQARPLPATRSSPPEQ